MPTHLIACHAAALECYQELPTLANYLNLQWLLWYVKKLETDRLDLSGKPLLS